MKVALRGGHTLKSLGARLLFDEVEEDRKVYKAVLKYLIQGGFDVIDVTPPENMSYPDELNYGIDKANRENADLFVSIHFNNAYTTAKNIAIGSEVWVYDKKHEYAKRVQNKLVSLGFKDRGVKSLTEHNGKKLAELTKTKMRAMIIEVCFVESIVDYDIYKKNGHDLIGKRIAEGILNKTLVKPIDTNNFKIVCNGLSEDKARKGVELLNKNGFNSSYIKM